MNENEFAILSSRLNQIVTKLTIGTFPWSPKELIRLLESEKIYTDAEAAFLVKEWNNGLLFKKTAPSALRLIIIRPQTKILYQTVSEI